MDLINTHALIAVLLYSGIGLVIFIGGFFLLEILTPKIDVWQEICHKQNVALAVLLGAVVLGVAIIIAAAIHG